MIPPGNPWSVWNGYYLRLNPTRGNRNLRGRARRQQQHDWRQQISQDWSIIAVTHPRDHAHIKARIRDAIQRLNTAETEANTAVSRAHRSNEQKQNSGMPVNADVWEAAVQALLRRLALMERLKYAVAYAGVPEGTLLALLRPQVTAIRIAVDDANQNISNARQMDMSHPARREAFQRDMAIIPPLRGRMWYSHLQTGLCSVVGLWLCGDFHGRITDRVVIKDDWFTSRLPQWTDPAWWYGDANDPLRKTPPEAHIMDRLNGTGSRNILNMRAWNLALDKLMYRIYLEYCPFGDGIDLMAWYVRLNLNRRNVPGAGPQHIPEPVIWHIFDSLANAGLVIEQGAVENPPQRWAEIIHMDMKPDNIMFGDYPIEDPDHPSQGIFALYPTVKLGDFGHSIDAWRNPDPITRSMITPYLNRGTRGYFAPEQIPPNGRRQQDLNAKTNVWQVGITVMALMNLNSDTGDLQGFKAAEPPLRDENHPSLVPRFNAMAQARYSVQLRNLVLWCVQYLQDSRPDFAQLHGDILRNTDPLGAGVDLSQGARYGSPRNMPPGLGRMQGLKANNYAIGMAMPR